MRLATLEEDGWELRSAEEAQERNPNTFWIPGLDRRHALRRGQGVKLLFAIRTSPDSGDHGEISVERMWVVVSDRAGFHFIGRLVNEPVCVPDGEMHYLRRGVEIPFGVEHVADIDDPPEADAARILAGSPAARWTRDGGR